MTPHEQSCTACDYGYPESACICAGSGAVSHIQTVEDASDVTSAVTGDLRHRCPHVEEIDRGRVTITWRVAGRTYELHSLREYLAGFADARLSHEEVTDRIRHDLSVADGIELVSVETTWLTAGLEVSCSTSPILAGLL